MLKRFLDYLQIISATLSILTLVSIITIFGIAKDTFINLAGGYTEREWDRREQFFKISDTWRFGLIQGVTLDECYAATASVVNIEDREIDWRPWRGNLKRDNSFGFTFSSLEGESSPNTGSTIDLVRARLVGNVGCYIYDFGVEGTEVAILLVSASSSSPDIDANQYKDAIYERITNKIGGHDGLPQLFNYTNYFSDDEDNDALGYIPVRDSKFPIVLDIGPFRLTHHQLQNCFDTITHTEPGTADKFSNERVKVFTEEYKATNALSEVLAPASTPVIVDSGVELVHYNPIYQKDGILHFEGSEVICDLKDP